MGLGSTTERTYVLNCGDASAHTHLLEFEFGPVKEKFRGEP
jgi:hypothetical protein